MFTKKNLKKALLYFSKTEIAIWLSSISLILISFYIFDGKNYLNMLASLIGATSLIFCAKGNAIGQFLIIIFSSLYGYISWTFSYYGEMLTYLFMTLPMAIISLFSWLKNSYKGNKMQVEVNKIGKKEVVFAIFLTMIITIIFYFLLAYFNTANIVVSTISIATSFIAAYFTFRRSEYFAVCYALNDVILMILWILATLENTEYVSVFMCFAVFLLNDIYSFINWKRIKKRQKQGA